ncbi:hypothetical protein HYT95_02375, partial [Candidatus Peregrinibacteria bacterium]|nr:hypothetical protein [Candidatus Peregrinibacteria bacterium]
MNKHLSVLLALGVVGVLAAGVMQRSAAGRGLMASVTEECVGKPYGTAGCPVKASSSSFAKAITCGNGYIEQGEECDLGVTKNGFSNCTKDCRRLSCGDGLISPFLKEECEPEAEEVYALDKLTGELTVDTQYVSLACGVICTVPVCDLAGNCTGGCKRSFLPACPRSSSEGAVVVVSSSGATAESGGAALTTVAAAAASPPDVPCGNGRADPGEQCDDGNATDADTCTTACRVAVCGDGIAQPWEQCDDGNATD